MNDEYEIGAFLTGVVVFFGVWAICWSSYGFLGFALGWMPALVLAYILGFLWPLVLLLLIIGGLALFLMNR